MRSQNRKYNSSGKVGGASCLLLLLLTFLAVNPIISSSAFAEEAPENEVDEASIPALQAEVSSTVGISFSPARYYAELSPTDNAGQSARIDLQTTIYVYNSGGYSVYLKSDSPNLVGEKNSSNFIPGATIAKSYTDMDVNTWGYTWASDTTAVANDATYKAVSVSGNGDKLAENTDDDIEVDTKTIALSFATKINNEKPADTYSNTMMLSVVSSPAQAVVSWDEMTTMQEMTAKACTMATTGSSKQLKDTRDGKFYWVSKLADGKCWMTQNLDLDLSKDVKLTADTSDVSEEGWTPGYNTATIADSNTVDNSSQTQTRSWSLGNYRITAPDESNTCGYPRNSAADCSAQFTAYITPAEANGDVNAHYILGNHYQWNAATAGTGGTIMSGRATNSICPKGWRLPTSNTGDEFEALVTALGGTSSTDNVTKAPFYGARSGDVNQSTTGLFGSAGLSGSYWSSTPDSLDSNAYFFNFSGVKYVDPSANHVRSFGFSIRCIAR